MSAPVASSQQKQINTAGSWPSLSYGPGSGSNRWLVVGFAINAQQISGIATVTFKGVALRRAGFITIGSTVRVEIWWIPERLVDMSSSGTIAWTLSSGSPSTAGEHHMWAITYEDCAQYNGLRAVVTGGDTGGGGSTLTLAVPSEAGGAVFSMICTFSTSDITVGSGDGTEIDEHQSGSNIDDSQLQNAAGTGSDVSIQFGGLTTGGSDDRCAVAISIRDFGADDDECWVNPDNDATSAGGTNASGGIAISLPANREAGDLIVLQFTQDTAPTITHDGTDWEEKVNQAQGTATKTMVWCRIATGDANDAITVTGAGQDYSYACYVVRNHAASDLAVDVLAGAATGSSSTPDPPNLNVGVSKKWAFLEGFGADDDDDTPSYWSSGYEGIAQQQSASSTSSCLAAAAFRIAFESPSSENPGVMAMAATEEWVAYTLAVPPAAGGAGDQNATGSPASVTVSGVTGHVGVGGIAGAAPLAATTGGVGVAGSPAAVAVDATQGSVGYGVDGSPAGVTVAAPGGHVGVGGLPGSAAPSASTGGVGVGGAPAAVAVDATEGAAAVAGVQNAAGVPAAVPVAGTTGHVGVGGAAVEIPAGGTTGNVGVSGAPGAVVVDPAQGSSANEVDGAPASVPVAAQSGHVGVHGLAAPLDAVVTVGGVGVEGASGIVNVLATIGGVVILSGEIVFETPAVTGTWRPRTAGTRRAEPVEGEYRPQVEGGLPGVSEGTWRPL